MDDKPLYYNDGTTSFSKGGRSIHITRGVINEAWVFYVRLDSGGRCIHLPPLGGSELLALTSALKDYTDERRS